MRPHQLFLACLCAPVPVCTRGLPTSSADSTVVNWLMHSVLLGTSRYEALELSGDFHKGAAAVYEGLAHLKGTPPDKSAADMAAELAETASKKLQIKRACASPKKDLDF